MATLYQDNEKFVLGRNDTKILLALLKGPSSGYQIASQCQLDDNSTTRMSNGSLRPALLRLQEMSLVSNGSNNYQITPLGREVLQWEVDRLNRLIKLARGREN